MRRLDWLILGVIVAIAIMVWLLGKDIIPFDLGVSEHGDRPRA